MSSEREEVSTEETVSLDDIVRENQELRDREEDARAVLGNSDHNVCSYDKGYVGRQALYACKTCRGDTTNSESRAGVCLACSYACHDGHELVELYTKRDFRCDCGNDKFPDLECKLNDSKARRNEENVYNQNYDGVYCICHRPYPDPDDDVEDEMIQCVVCEDWYHGRHLTAPVPEHYHEMVCQLCAGEHNFLKIYSRCLVEMEAEDKDKAVEEGNKDKAVGTEVGNENKLDLTEKDEKCILSNWKKKLEEKEKASTIGAIFFPAGWRESLCHCDDCRQMYKDRGVARLTLASDSVEAYESGAGGDAVDGEAALGNIIGGMDRFQQGELVAGYCDMKANLQEYLKKFAENGKVVRAEDIREFFEDLESRKKMRGDPKYFCG